MRIALIVIALVLDGLCLALIAAVTFMTRTTTSEVIGLGMFAVVIASNLPPLIWAIRRRKTPDATAGVFD